MSAADKIEVGQFWANKADSWWLKVVVTGLSSDGWVRYTTVGNAPGSAQYARPVDDFLRLYSHDKGYRNDS